MTAPCSSVELSDGTYSAAQSDLHTKVSEQGEELQTLHKTLLAINKGVSYYEGVLAVIVLAVIGLGQVTELLRPNLSKKEYVGAW